MLPRKLLTSYNTHLTIMKSLAKKIDKPIFHLVGDVADSLSRECYAVGGFVRDLFLNRPSKDLDFVTIGSGIELAQGTAKALGKNASLAVYQNFGTAQVKSGNFELEFVGARRESYQRNSRKPIVEDGTLEDDISRRDFTINAMAICVNKSRFGELIDFYDGVGDLERKLIRTPLDPNITFSDDPLRMMRAVRFATQLNFTIYPETFKAISDNAERIKIISKERVADELMKIMKSPRPSIGWELLLKSGLLKLIFPQFAAMAGIEVKNGRGHKDNFYHTMEVLDNVSSKSDNVWLRWAALLHDIGKPRAKAWDDKIGWTFHNHDFVGAKMIPNIFHNLKLPLNEKMKYVQKMVELHMRPIALVEDIVTDSAVRRLLFDAGDDIDDLMTLCEADITSKQEAKVKRFLENYVLVRNKMTELEERDRIRNFQPPVSGDEIIKAFNLTPSREVGILKAKIKDAILDGIIPNEREAAYNYMLKCAEEMGLTPQ